jgi:hypothetical protein
MNTKEIDLDLFICSNEDCDIIINIKYFKKQVNYDSLLNYIEQFINKLLLDKKKIFNNDLFIVYIYLKGYKIKEFDYDFIKNTIHFLENKFPNNLNKVLIYDSNIIIKGIYKLFKPFIHKDTREKIFFMKKL